MVSLRLPIEEAIKQLLVSAKRSSCIAHIFGFALYYSWPYFAFMTSSLLVFNAHDGRVNDACWVVSLSFVACTLILLSALGSKADGLLKHKACTVISILAYLMLNIGMVVGGLIGGTFGVILLVASSAFVGIATGFLDIIWGRSIARCGSSETISIIIASIILAFLLVLFIPALPMVLRPGLVLIGITASCGILVKQRPWCLEETYEEERLTLSSDTYSLFERKECEQNSASNIKSIFLRGPLAFRDYTMVFFCFACLSFVESFYRNFRMIDQQFYSAVMLCAVIAAALLAVTLIKFRRAASFGAITRIVVPLLTVSLLLAVALPHNRTLIAFVLVFICATIVRIFVWTIGIAYGSLARGCVQRTLGIPLSVLYAGLAVGSLAPLLKAYVDPTILAFAFTVAVCSFSIISSNDSAERPPLVIQKIADTRTLACGGIAERCGLTKREAEILALYAKGRSSAYISSSCFISKNTVETHLKHIYEKTMVGTKQELIDLVESEELTITQRIENADEIL